MKLNDRRQLPFQNEINSIPAISHLQFVEDTLLWNPSFTVAHLINAHRSKVFFNVILARQVCIITILGFERIPCPSKYLSIPLFLGQFNRLVWADGQDLWKYQAERAKWLALAGKLQLLKLVLQSVAMHMMSILRVKMAWMFFAHLMLFKRIPFARGLRAWKMACLPKTWGSSGLCW
jgi:hypothetical protein